MYFTSTNNDYIPIDNILYTKQIDDCCKIIKTSKIKNINETVNFLLKTVNDFVLLNLETNNKKDYSLDEVNTIIDKLTYYYKLFNNLLPSNNSSEYYILNYYTEMIENFANSLTED